MSIDYDPEEHGAKCSVCPLKQIGREPVPPEPAAAQPELYIVGEAPGRDEEKQGRPFVGRTGQRLMKDLDYHGLDRHEVSLDNAILCYPPDGDLKRYLARLRQRNARLKKQGEEPIPSPVECCAPRLRKKAKDAPALFLLGKTAFDSLALPSLRKEIGKGSKKKPALADYRGFPISVSKRSIPTIASYHPAFGLRVPKWLPVIRNDLGKLIRHRDGELRWQDPKIVYNASYDVLKRQFGKWLRSGEWVAYDLETDGLDRRTTRVRCIGIGTPELVHVIGFLSVDGKGRFRTSAENKRYWKLIGRFLNECKRLCGNNNVMFDGEVLRQNRYGAIEVETQFDGALGHVVWQSEHRANLDHIMSTLTDSPKHKAVDHNRWESDEELWLYNARDVAGSAATAPAIYKQVKRSGQDKAYKTLAARRFSPTPEKPEGHFGGLAGICAGLNRIGLRIDLTERDRHDVRLRRKMVEATQAANEHMSPSARNQMEAFLSQGKGKPRKFNLGSPQQVRQLLFEVYGLQAPRDKNGKYLFENDTGDPSTSEDAILALIDTGPPKEVEDVLFDVLAYRGAQKTRGYCKGRTHREYEREMKAYKAGQLRYRPTEPSWWIDPDHRIRADWGPWTVSSRLTCSRPNLMNLPRPDADGESVRSMYVPAPGNVFVGADYSQLELRIIALITKDEVWLEAFHEDAKLRAQGKTKAERKKWDAHDLNVRHVFGLGPNEPVSDNRRQLLKTMIYAWCYGCAPKKLLQLVKAVREADGSRPFADLALKDLEFIDERLKKLHPGVVRWQEAVVERWESNGYIRSKLNGRQRLFQDSVYREQDYVKEQEAMLNFEVQASGADIVIEGMFNFLDACPWGAEGPGTPGPYGPGLVEQCHDSLAAEVYERYGEQMVPVMTDAMTLTIDGLLFPAEAETGMTLGAVA